jgi:hypothetical protein
MLLLISQQAANQKQRNFINSGFKARKIKIKRLFFYILTALRGEKKSLQDIAQFQHKANTQRLGTLALEESWKSWTQN